MKTTQHLLVVTSLIVCHLSASAAIITFTFGATEDQQSSFTQTVSGVTLTAGSPNSDNGKFASDSEGLVLSSDSSQGPNSFQFSFSSAVQVVSYTIGAVIDPTSGSFTLSRAGETSTLNDLGTVGSFSISGPFNPTANQTISLTSNPTGSPGWSQIKSFTVNTVPEPPETLALVGLACGVGAWVIRSKPRQG